MAAFQTDEEFARQLQAQFEEEESLQKKQEETDLVLAMAYAKAHTISDSDSDATLDPDEFQKDMSPDLFDGYDDQELKTLSSTNKMKRGKAESALSKRDSKYHKLSDSDSDQGRNVKMKHSQSPVQKKRKSFVDDYDAASPLKKKKSMIRDEHSHKEITNVFKKHKTAGNSPNADKSSPKLELKKVRSRIHSLSDSDSENVDHISKCKTTSSEVSSSSHSSHSTSEKPVCEYGPKCFRKNPSHLAQYRHPDTSSSPNKLKKIVSKSNYYNVNKSGNEIYNENQPFSFLMTKVTGVEKKYNACGAIGIKDILSTSMGNLEASCQFNYMFDINWLMKQYPEEFRKKPLTLVHGEQRGSLASLLADTAPYPNITCVQAKLEIMYGTHHTKMMLLLYDNGLRVVIHTSNLIENDWYQKSQGVWLSPVFPKISPTSGGDGKIEGDSPTHFKRDLLQYLAAYRAPRLTIWEKHIKAHDMSAANVFIVGSVPGRHTGEQKTCWGHMKLRKILQQHGPQSSTVKTWPVIGQFSSIGSLGPTVESWLRSEWLQSLSATKGATTITPAGSMNFVFPSVDNVRLSLEGYPGGGCIPYSINTAKKQVYVHQHFRQWKSDGRGRSRACPHIKTYLRHSPDGKEIAWFHVTSANLSKAAWGMFEKNGAQLMIRSYEIGVLFLPKYFGCDTFPVTSDPEEAILRGDEAVFPLPYDLPLTPYVKGDRPWMIDVPCVNAPDTNGNKWCPPL